MEEPKTSIVDIGKEFAFEGMNPNSFKGTTAQEYRDFKEGYEEGLRIMRERQQVFDNMEIEETKFSGIKK